MHNQKIFPTEISTFLFRVHISGHHSNLAFDNALLGTKHSYSTLAKIPPNEIPIAQHESFADYVHFLAATEAALMMAAGGAGCSVMVGEKIMIFGKELTCKWREFVLEGETLTIHYHLES